tara:strand:- start:801 stop:1013 length:213 start_codon:yes stop_codon:yes gene_type:complete
MVMNEEEVREKCVELAEMCERNLLTIERLKDHIFGMCEIIHYQCPLKEQDRWMEDMIAQGLYTAPKEDFI